MDPETLREDFPILSVRLHGDVPLVYLDNAATTQRPRQVIQSLVDVYEKQYANVHRGIHWLSDQSTDLYEEAREKARAFINARHREEVIFTYGTTEGINLVARSWGGKNVGAGDEILLTEMEHHSNLVPWQQLAQERGAVLRHIPITDDGRLAMDALPALLSRRPKLVAVAAVSNVVGTINPVAEIARQAHAAGALVLVDAAQSVPHLPTDVQALGVDFLAFSGHKMLGPSGVGILYGRRELLDAMPPFLGGGSMIRRVKLDTFEPAELPAKFEAGTPPIVPAIGLGTAIDYLHAIGLERIHEYERMLTIRAHQVLQSVGGVRLLGPAPEHKAGIVSFTLEGIHAHDVAQILDRHGIAARAGHHCAMPLHKRLGTNASVRASFYFYNTLAEVEQLAAALVETKRVFRKA
ncbi:MAG: SufS family cysteine desulfurase [Planctomycetia bacterium]|nr:SufS family cysteine desulfurase [Planctomycetia bacterium]